VSTQLHPRYHTSESVLATPGLRSLRCARKSHSIVQCGFTQTSASEKNEMFGAILSRFAEDTDSFVSVNQFLIVVRFFLMYTAAARTQETDHDGENHHEDHLVESWLNPIGLASYSSNATVSTPMFHLELSNSHRYVFSSPHLTSPTGNAHICKIMPRVRRATQMGDLEWETSTVHERVCTSRCTCSPFLRVPIYNQMEPLRVVVYRVSQVNLP